MEVRYSKEQFDGYTYRFIVRFKVDEDWSNDRLLTIYSNSGDHQRLSDFINAKKTGKVIGFTIEHSVSREKDEMDAEFIDEVLSGLNESSNRSQSLQDNFGWECYMPQHGCSAQCDDCKRHDEIKTLY